MDISSNDLPYFSCILARDIESNGIGFENKIPWKVKEDLEFFKYITTKNSENKENIVVMGKNTWNGLKNPLKNRINIVVSKTIQEGDSKQCTIASDLNDALKKCKSFGKGRYIFVIGGESLYRESFLHPRLESIYLTEIKFYKSLSYDVFFRDVIPSNFKLQDESFIEEKDYNIKFSKWNRILENYSDEQTFLDLLSIVLTEGDEKKDRTGVGTMSFFGPQLEFDLSNSFPLLTTKKVPLRVVFEELIWFLRGQTSNLILKEKNVHIWDDNSSEEYMKRIGLSHYPEGELGPIYGAQWRNFGGKHDLNLKNHINDGGVDQVSEVIKELKSNPDSRRMIVSAWNPKELKNMALPPCHVMWQLYVRNKKYLDCKLTIRSNDLFLGAPFNIASYSLLVYMISSMTGYSPGRLVYSIGDAHIYLNHLEQVREMVCRTVRPFPKLTVLKTHEKIEEFEYSDFKVEEYDPHPSIKGEMAV